MVNRIKNIKIIFCAMFLMFISCQSVLAENVESITEDAAQERLIVAENWFEKGVNFTHNKNHFNAIEAYTKAIELDPQYVDAYFNRAYTYAIKQEYNRALVDYNRVIELYPESGISYIFRGNIFVLLHKNEEAINDFNAAIKSKSKNIVEEAYFDLAQVLELTGRRDASLENYKITLKLLDKIPGSEKHKIKAQLRIQGNWTSNKEYFSFVFKEE